MWVVSPQGGCSTRINAFVPSASPVSHCVSGSTLWRTPSSSLTSRRRTTWTPCCLSSPRPSWTRAPSLSTSWDGWGRMGAKQSPHARQNWERIDYFRLPFGLFPINKWLKRVLFLDFSLLLSLVLIPSCLSDQDSPINKLLYARDIPRYKQMVERWVQFELKLL